MKRFLLCVALALCACTPSPEPAKTMPPEAARLPDELRAYDREVMSALEVKSTAKLTPDEERAIKRGTTLNQPATRDDLRELERRIGRKLPHSYREFLLVSNGMVFHGALNVVTMQPTSAVQPLTAENYPSLDAWLSMPDVAVPLDPSAGGPLPGPALAHAWVVSSVEDGDVYLIFPELARPDGEWPVWFFGSKSPGAIAYPSFAAMFERERGRGLQELRDR